MRVKTDGLNLRKKPIVKPKTLITALPLAHPVTLLGEAEREGWKKVELELKGKVLKGVVSGKYLRVPESEAKEALMHETVKEWISFHRGKEKEDKEPYFRFVGDMWKALGMDLDGKDTDVPWSAAFISYVVRNAGYDGFRFAAAHARYIHDSIVKRNKGDNRASFWGFRLREHRPKLGDIVCQWRVNPRTFNEATRIEAFKSHCDVIVELNDTFVRAIGGNVRNSVSMKTCSLNSNGFLKSKNNVFAIMRNNL